MNDASTRDEKEACLVAGMEERGAFPMRRARQRLSDEHARQLLADHGATNGVLALCDGDVPYQVPLSYVYEGPSDAYPQGAVYFHCALKGRKLDIAAANPRASFCVVTSDDVVPDEFTTHYRDVIACGRLEVVEDEDERHHALTALGLAYAGDMPNRGELTQQEIDKSAAATCVLALRIEEICGKQARELIDRP